MDAKNAIVVSCNELRAQLKATGDAILRLKNRINDLSPEERINTSQGDAIANVVLSYRHNEDSVMRLGKVIQALEGGVSILDHPKVKAVIQELRATNG